MTINEWGSWAVSLGGLFAWWIMGRKTWWAWYVVLVNEMGWIAFGVATRQYGFALTSVPFTAIGIRNAYKWTQEHRQELAQEATA
jgi:nicotinamide riboside transporter PnuC